MYCRTYHQLQLIKISILSFEKHEHFLNSRLNELIR